MMMVKPGQGHAKSLPPFHPRKKQRGGAAFRALTRGLLSLLLLGFLCACAISKKNAEQTLVTARHPAPGGQQVNQSASQSAAPFLSFDELVTLAQVSPIPPALEAKLKRFFSRPIISNQAPRDSRNRTRAYNPAMGEFLRVASWNIEKSIHAAEAAEVLRSESAYIQRLKPEVVADEVRLKEALRQRQRIVEADILLLQEMDIGVTRSGYIDATKTIAKAMGMNYAYAPQQLEIDPVTLGLEPSLPGKTAPPVDPKRYKGVFGIAVLSRYPILSAECHQLLSQPYNWYADEQVKPDYVERVRRFGAKELFHSQIEREMKVGGRIYFRVDLKVPGLPNDRLTVIHNHLEIKTTTRGREDQLKEVLELIRPIQNPIVMAGDHNSATSDISATSFKRVVKRTSTDPQTWVSVGSKALAVLPDVFNLARSTVNAAKNMQNPLAFDMPLILPNPTRRLFRYVEDFEFSDGGKFDKRGDNERSINGYGGNFGNANEHLLASMRPTFRVPRPIGPIGPIGRTRLDWIFVKQPPQWQGSYRFAPHFGETLQAFDTNFTRELSDHRPIVADLPFQEPPLLVK